MKYRVVLHVSSASGEDREALVLVDDRLTKALIPRHAVHGHDLGRGHLKIEVHTDDPAAAFETAKAVIPDQLLVHTSAFYSEIGSRREHSLWPPATAPDPR
jgi:hypothetical protein